MIRGPKMCLGNTTQLISTQRLTRRLCKLAGRLGPVVCCLVGWRLIYLSEPRVASNADNPQNSPKQPKMGPDFRALSTPRVRHDELFLACLSARMRQCDTSSQIGSTSIVVEIPAAQFASGFEAEFCGKGGQKAGNTSPKDSKGLNSWPFV